MWANVESGITLNEGNGECVITYMWDNVECGITLKAILYAAGYYIDVR